ncbi:zinc-binding dehydrogenase, partial [Phenylobacterium sp.]|uniref:zinc-binding dehydrogenase n=1 Tax=Phenylobacterium sp. TaxID=1871053 RepID=UPI0028116541
GTSGLIAVASAVALGAGRVIAAGRNPAALERARALGAHDTVVLGGDGLAAAFASAAGGEVDVVIDYLNGAPAEAALSVMALGGRMVQIGSLLAPGMQLHAQTARRQSLDVLGFAYYHAPIDEQRRAYGAVCDLALKGRAEIDIETTSLIDFAAAWGRQKAGGGMRQVLRP